MVDGDSIPQELQQLKRWVLWRAEGEKFIKVPYQPNGEKASSTNEKTWSSFEDVMNEYDGSDNIDGIGFVLSNDDDYCCVDIDGIEDFDMLDEVAEELLTMSYAEKSVSGNGLHIWFRHKVDKERHKSKNDKTKYEVYDNARYITFTGESLNDLPIAEGGERLNLLLDKVLKREEVATQDIVITTEGRGEAAFSEEKIINIAENSKKGERFKSFFYGGWEQNYDASEADLAFCNDLAFFTNCDYAMMDSIYRKSSIYKDRKGSDNPFKWDRPQNGTTYGDETLCKAIRECKSTLQPIENESFVFPSGYLSKNGCLFKRVINKRTGEFEETMICRQTPVITRSFMNVESPQLYHEITWKDNGKTYSETVPAGYLATRKKLIELADKSLAVSDWNVAELIRYFDMFNMIESKQREHLVERLGQIKEAFVHPLLSDGVTILPPDVGETQQLEAFQTSGTPGEWIENVLQPIKHHPKALLMVLSSFTSVLLKDLKLQPFIVDLSGITSTGKSTALRICASVWGNEHLVNEWNLTKVAAERKAAFLNSFPLILDDTRKAEPKELQRFVYNFSGGRSKGRGSVNGSQRELTWNNLLLSTGEAPLNAYAESAAGVAARILPITGLPFENVEYDFFEMIYGAIENQYGSIGVEFLKQWGKRRTQLTPEFAEYNALFQKQCKGNEVISRIARYYAAIVFTGKLLNVFFEANIDLKVLYEFFDTLNEDNQSTDKPKQLLEQMLQELDADRNSIYYEYEPAKSIKAIYKNSTLHLLPAYTKEFLKVEEKTIRSEWLRRGITAEKNHRGKKVDYSQVKHKGRNFTCIALNPQIIEELGFDFSETSQG